MAALVEHLLSDGDVWPERSRAGDLEHLGDRDLILAHEVEQVHYLDGHIRGSDGGMDLAYLLLDLIKLVLAKRWILITQVERAVQLLERDDAELLQHEVVDEQAELGIRELVLEIWDLLLESAGEVLGLHAIVSSVSPILLNHIVGASATSFVLLANPVDHLLGLQ